MRMSIRPGSWALLLIALSDPPVMASPVWALEQTLLGGVPSEPAGNDLLGFAVALDGSRMAVGAFSDDLELPGGTLGNAGSVYLFQHDGTQWTLAQRLVAPDAQSGALFGIDVALDGSALVVGARLHDSPAAGGGALEVDQGAVYVYRLLAGQWTLEQRLTPALALGAEAQFGWAVALHGDTLAVGAPDAGEGIVDVYQHTGGAPPWQLQQRLGRPSGSGFAGPNAFGRALSLGLDQLLVGAPLEDNPPLSHGDAGAAYVFVRANLSWSVQARLSPALPMAGAGFGTAVALHGAQALVGSPDETVLGLASAGMVDRLVQQAGVWSRVQRWQDVSPEGSARFGQSLACDDSHAAVGVYWAGGTLGAMEGKVQTYVAETGGAWVVGPTLRAPPGTRAPFNQFGTDVALDAGRIAVGEPGVDWLSNNDGAAHSYRLDLDPLFGDGFEATP